MDIVIALGTGSRWMDNELKYALRSIEAYRSDLIPEGDEQFDVIWDEVCTAMAVIEENLKVTA